VVSHRPKSGVLREARRYAALLALAASAVVVLLAGALRDRAAQPTSARPNPGGPSSLPSGAPENPALLEETATEGCTFADRGFGSYGSWTSLALGKLLIPPGGGVRDDGSYDLLMHFHGAEPIRKELAPRELGLVIYALDKGTASSHYERPFASNDAFPALVRSIDQSIAKASGREDVHAAHVAISSWSAGSGAAEQIVIRHVNQVGALLLLDSLYSGYGPGRHTLAHGQLPSIVGFARDALAGGAPLLLTYSAVQTSGYASSGETATFLLSELGRSARSIDANDPFGLSAALEEGHLTVRGYEGADKAAHCAHLRLLLPALEDVVLPSFRAR
jgi:hypothetical protein